MQKVNSFKFAKSSVCATRPGLDRGYTSCWLPQPRADDFIAGSVCNLANFLLLLLLLFRQRDAPSC